MDLLVTVIGNAVVDHQFRARLLQNPRAAIDEWGFRLTKGELEMLEAMFRLQQAGSEAVAAKPQSAMSTTVISQQPGLEQTFGALENALYGNLESLIVGCDRPCRMSISQPLTFKKAA
jgi:hypothetical protein